MRDLLLVAKDAASVKVALAAADLFNALVEVLEDYEGFLSDPAIVERAHAALRKAQPESHSGQKSGA